MIRGIGPTGGIARAGEGASATGGDGFAVALEAAVRSVDGAQHVADAQLRGLASGEAVDLEGAMIALEQADISLRAMGSVRDKLVEAWQAVWSMPI